MPDDIAWRLHAVDGELPEPTGILSPDELSRMESFGYPDRRKGFALGRMAARSLLAERLGLAPSEIPLAIAADDGLYVGGHSIHVSISHAGRGPTLRSLAGIAERRLGLDLEEIVPRREDLYLRILHPDEMGLMDSLDLAHNDAQLLLWSLKEAVLKGLRTGFRRSPKTVHLDDLMAGSGHAHLDDGPSWHLRYDRIGAFWASLAFQDQ